MRPADTYADPRVLQRLGGGDALERVHRQHLVDEVLGLRRHRVPFGRRILCVRIADGEKEACRHVDWLAFWGASGVLTS